MADTAGLTEQDLERIAAFVSLPRSRRRPSMLCPEPDGGDDVE